MKKGIVFVFLLCMGASFLLFQNCGKHSNTAPIDVPDEDDDGPDPFEDVTPDPEAYKGLQVQWPLKDSYFYTTFKVAGKCNPAKYVQVTAAGDADFQSFPCLDGAFTGSIVEPVGEAARTIRYAQDDTNGDLITSALRIKQIKRCLLKKPLVSTDYTSVAAYQAEAAPRLPAACTASGGAAGALCNALKEVPILANDYIEFNVNFPSAGNYFINVRAREIHAGGKSQFARVILTVDGRVFGTFNISKTEIATFGSASYGQNDESFTIPAGTKKVRLSYINDVSGSMKDGTVTVTQNRGVYIDYIALYKVNQTACAIPAESDIILQSLRTLATLRNIKIGVGTRNGFSEVEYANAVNREFNAIAPANMTADLISTGPGKTNFAAADAQVNVAVAKGQKVHGFALVSKNHVPAWLKDAFDVKKTLTQAQVREWYIDYIQTVVTHFKGRVHSWDVVSGHVNDVARLTKPAAGFNFDHFVDTANFWYRAVGSDYLELAFKTADAADKAAVLYIHETNILGSTSKMQELFDMLKGTSGILQKRIPIEGASFDASESINFPESRANMVVALKKYGGAGLDVQITGADAYMTGASSAAKQKEQAYMYKEFVQACLETPQCSGVYLKGVTDKYLTSSAQVAPRIFDASYQRKPAYNEIQRVLYGIYPTE